MKELKKKEEEYQDTELTPHTSRSNATIQLNMQRCLSGQGMQSTPVKTRQASVHSQGEQAPLNGHCTQTQCASKERIHIFRKNMYSCGEQAVV
jgi:hypothetical protein